MTPAVTWLLEATPDKPVLISIWEGRVYVKPNVFTEATWVGLGRRELTLLGPPSRDDMMDRGLVSLKGREV